MKKMDENGLLLCKYQARLFEYSTSKNISSKQFIKDFSYSNLSKRMGNVSFLFETLDTAGAYLEIEENKPFKKGEVYNENIISWIGYIYRYTCYIYEKDMKDIYKKIKPQELYDLYDAYHSLDNELAIKRILEAKNIDFNNKNATNLLKKYYNL